MDLFVVNSYGSAFQVSTAEFEFLASTSYKADILLTFFWFCSCRHCLYASYFLSCPSYGVFHSTNCQTILKMEQPAF